jgi:hypothetical protein
VLELGGNKCVPVFENCLVPTKEQDDDSLMAVLNGKKACPECISTHAVNSDGRCQPCSDFIEGCSVCNSTEVCSECTFGYKFYDNICVIDDEIPGCIKRDPV